MKLSSLTLLPPTAILILSLFLTGSNAVAQDGTGRATNRISDGASQEVSPELMRSFLHLQEQVHQTQLAVERSRMEADAAASRNTEALNARLKLIEDAMERASRENTAAMVEANRQIGESNRQIQKSNNRMVLLASLFALIVLGALGFAGWLQWKAVSRITTLPHSGMPTLLSSGYGSLGAGGHPAQLASTQLMSVLGRLEHRIAEMEDTTDPSKPLKVVPVSDSDSSTRDSGITAAAETDAALADVIQEGEELLAGEDAQKAVDHFDALLSKHPGNPELLLRKGTALERLERDQEAIECYDQAIQSDPHLTMAYLHKGGLFNRMERFTEAMECYEQALRVQEHRRSA